MPSNAEREQNGMPMHAWERTLNTTMKSIAAAAILTAATPAFAGGVTVAEEGDSKLKLEALLFLNTYSQKA